MENASLHVKLSDMLRRFGIIAAMAWMAGCNLNRTADEGFTEVDRPGFPDNGSGTGLPHYELERVACVDRINTFRATEGLPPLRRWLGAESCSDLEAEGDSKTGIAHDHFQDCGEWAQNECPGWNSVGQVVQGCLQAMWDEKLVPSGPQGHYVNMTNTQYSEVSCGFYETPQGPVWAVQNFR